MAFEGAFYLLELRGLFIELGAILIIPRNWGTKSSFINTLVNPSGCLESLSNQRKLWGTPKVPKKRSLKLRLVVLMGLGGSRYLLKLRAYS